MPPEVSGTKKRSIHDFLIKIQRFPTVFHERLSVRDLHGCTDTNCYVCATSQARSKLMGAFLAPLREELKGTTPPKCCNSQEKRQSTKICESQRKTATLARFSLLVCPFYFPLTSIGLCFMTSMSSVLFCPLPVSQVSE